MMNWKIFGRKGLWPSSGTLLIFAWRDWGKPWSASGWLASSCLELDFGKNFS